MFPSIGEKIYLEPVFQDEEKPKVYHSRVVDADPQTFRIELPFDEHGDREPYPVGTEFTCWFIGEDGGQYRFKTYLIRRTADMIPLWVMNRPLEKEIERTQRRHHLRVDAHLDVAIKSMVDTRAYHYVTQTKDVSGGGISFIAPSSHEIKASDRIRGYLAIPLKNEGIVHSSFIGEVVRLFRPKENSEIEVVSVKFLSIPEREMEALIRYTYQRQIELFKRTNEKES